MNRNTDSSHHSGIGLPGILGVAFIVLKLAGFIDWSWTWVLAPFWMTFCLAVVIWISAVILMSARGRW